MNLPVLDTLLDLPARLRKLRFAGVSARVVEGLSAEQRADVGLPPPVPLSGPLSDPLAAGRRIYLESLR